MRVNAHFNLRKSSNFYVFDVFQDILEKKIKSARYLLVGLYEQKYYIWVGSEGPRT